MFAIILNDDVFLYKKVSDEYDSFIPDLTKSMLLNTNFLKTEKFTPSLDFYNKNVALEMPFDITSAILKSHKFNFGDSIIPQEQQYITRFVETSQKLGIFSSAIISSEYIGKVIFAVSNSAEKASAGTLVNIYKRPFVSHVHNRIISKNGRYKYRLVAKNKEIEDFLNMALYQEIEIEEMFNYLEMNVELSEDFQTRNVAIFEFSEILDFLQKEAQSLYENSMKESKESKE